MLETVLIYLFGARSYNWPIARGGLHFGKFEIKNGEIAAPVFYGQYFRIVGSVFNDGVYKYGEDLKLTDEEFEGAVWALSIPPALVELVNEITEWNAKNKDAVNSPYQSESFGGYSYTKASDSATGRDISWQTIFRSRLSEWRKI